MKLTCAGRTGVDYAVSLRTAGERYASRWQQRDDEIVGWSGADVCNTEVESYVFARIDYAVSGGTTLSNNRGAAVTKHRQLPAGNTNLPDTSTVSGDAQVALHVGNLHIKYSHARQARAQRQPVCAT